ncbi:MAG: anaerobic ribonucleoside-triphosphate reductase activating protein [Erysipelotrichaceae bacterium]|nr:anaerobic ribonucleoside-triphosphate reductase activating protein [Erysipelotrichaceae bacterium]
MFVGMEKLSLVDYDDKISCVLFKPGCNFACPFCHNSPLVIDAKENIEIPFETILNYLTKRKGSIDAVVISGGEPTLDPELKNEIIAIKKLGFLIKLDTNGTNPKLIKELIDDRLIDYVAMDIKNSPKKYPLTAGVKTIDFSKIEKSIRLLMTSNIDYEFRTTLVNEFHDEESINEMGKLLLGAKRMYLQLFKDRGTNIASNLHEVTKEKALVYKSILVKYNINKVELRGY